MDDDFGFYLSIFSFRVPNSTKMAVTVPGRQDYTKLAVRFSI
jgi:hypothetical protein